jgi:hypothetical protein
VLFVEINSQDFQSVHRPLHFTSESCTSRFTRSVTQTRTHPAATASHRFTRIGCACAPRFLVTKH